MSDLFTALYDHALTQSRAYLALAPEYAQSCLYSEEKEAALAARLGPEESSLLRGLLDELSLQQAEEQRALFRAALALRRDLDLVLLWGWRR